MVWSEAPWGTTSGYALALPFTLSSGGWLSLEPRSGGKGSVHGIVHECVMASWSLPQKNIHGGGEGVCATL